MTDVTGTPKQNLQYYPYGGTRQEWNDPGSATIPKFNGEHVKHRFTGHERDFAIGIYYAQQRYYDQRLARFISPDPVGPDLADPQSLNPYAYCRNNPVKYVDPQGAESASFSDYWEVLKKKETWQQIGSGSKKYFKAFEKSFNESFNSAVEGTVESVKHPVETVRSIGTALGTASANPGETAKSIGTSLLETGKAMFSGDPERAGAATGGFLGNAWGGAVAGEAVAMTASAVGIAAYGAARALGKADAVADVAALSSVGQIGMKVKMPIGTPKMGATHIALKHLYSSTYVPKVGETVTRFARGTGIHDVRRMVQHAIDRGAGFSGGQVLRVVNFNFYRTIGASGETSMRAVILSKTSEIITAFPY